MKIATALGLGRRVVENALRRGGVEISAKKRTTLAPTLSSEAARAWFAAAERPEAAELHDPAPPQRLVEGVTTFRRRRCQGCGQLTSYVVTCPRCGAPLDAPGEG